MHDEVQLRRSLALAREAGDRAADALRRIATGNSEPTDRSAPGDRLFGSSWPLRGVAVTASQIRDARGALDVFVGSVEDVDLLLDARGLPGNLGALLAGASLEHWESTLAAAGAYERVTDTLANLERLRIAIVLRRPLLRPVEEEAGAATTGESPRDRRPHRSGSP